MMSEQTADSSSVVICRRLDLRGVPISGSGVPAPGCLTSEDEEREAWTAESLRVSGTKALKVFVTCGPDERLRRYTF
jgi:hypothetical protein